MTLLGRTIKNYTLVERIGSGGMGAVFLARHRKIGRRAAIKVMHPRFASRPEVLQRFFNEARAANQARHQNIVDIYEHGTAPEIGPYLIMEYLDGETLKARLKREGRMSPEQIATILQRVCSALHAAHANGIVHRDVKPGNIYLMPDADHPGDDRVKLLDFGVAKLVDDSEDARIPTEVGMLLGTPNYMSPEQCRGSTFADHRADIYSLGVIAYEAVCGEPPFSGRADGHVLAAHLRQKPIPPSYLNPYVPSAFEEVILRALEKNPADRFQSVRKLGNALLEAAEEVSGEVITFQEEPAAAGETAGAEAVIGDPASLATDQALASWRVHPVQGDADDLSGDFVERRLITEVPTEETLLPERARPPAISEIPAARAVENEAQQDGIIRAVTSRLTPLRVVAGTAGLFVAVGLGVVLSQGSVRPKTAAEAHKRTGRTDTERSEMPTRTAADIELDSIEELLDSEEAGRRKEAPEAPGTLSARSRGSKDGKASGGSSKRARATTEYKLGMKHISGGRRHGAIKSLKKAIKIDPGFAAPHKALGIALVASGDVAGMCRELRVYIRLAPDASDVLRIREQMSRYAATVPACREK